MPVKVTKQHLADAVDEKIISSQQADALFRFLQGQPGVGPTFDFTHILYYLGGLVAIGAMTLFMTLGWEAFGGWGIFVIALAYGCAGFALARYFQQAGYAVPAGICAAFAVAITPLAIYGLQNGLGLWPDDTVYRSYHRYIKWHWIFMELGTLAVGAVMVWRFRYGFLLMPVAITLWYMSMDVAVMLSEGRPTWEFRAFVSMWFGLAVILLALWVDIRTRRWGDYAFWLYLIGVITFWGGLTSQSSESELTRFFYLLMNLGLIGIGAVLVRRVFVVFGALGVAGYLGYLAADVFADSWGFPVALTAIGLLIVYAGVVWQRHEKQVTERAHALLPPPIREWLQARSA